jgi:hypothetical protein
MFVPLLYIVEHSLTLRCDSCLCLSGIWWNGGGLLCVFVQQAAGGVQDSQFRWGFSRINGLTPWWVHFCVAYIWTASVEPVCIGPSIRVISWWACLIFFNEISDLFPIHLADGSIDTCGYCYPAEKKNVETHNFNGSSLFSLLQNSTGI